MKVQGGEKGFRQEVLYVLVGFDTKDQGHEISCEESITINHYKFYPKMLAQASTSIFGDIILIIFW